MHQVGTLNATGGGGVGKFRKRVSNTVPNICRYDLNVYEEGAADIYANSESYLS